MISRLASVPVFVSDQERALEFYRDKLELEVVMDFPAGGPHRWLTLAREPGETELILFHPDAFAGNGLSPDELRKRVGQWTGIVFRVDDIDDAYRRLRDRGVAFKNEPRQQPWGGIEAQFSDPDGNEFHLVQVPDYMT